MATQKSFIKISTPTHFGERCNPHFWRAYFFTTGGWLVQPPTEMMRLQLPGVAKPKGQGWRGVTTARGQLMQWWRVMMGDGERGESHEKWSDFVRVLVVTLLGTSRISLPKTHFWGGDMDEPFFGSRGLLLPGCKNEGKWRVLGGSRFPILEISSSWWYPLKGNTNQWHVPRKCSVGPAKPSRILLINLEAMKTCKWHHAKLGGRVDPSYRLIIFFAV